MVIDQPRAIVAIVVQSASRVRGILVAGAAEHVSLLCAVVPVTAQASVQFPQQREKLTSELEMLDDVFAFHNPCAFPYHHGWTKWPLRRGLQQALPGKVACRRSEFGFGVPQDRWLCGLLRPALTQWLDSDRPLWDWVDRATVRRLAEETWQTSGCRDEPGQALVRSFLLDKWISGGRSSMSPRGTYCIRMKVAVIDAGCADIWMSPWPTYKDVELND